MPEKDAVSIAYFEDKKRFADFLNGYLFDGKEQIKVEDISEKSRIITRTQKKRGRIRIQRLERDVARQVNIKMKMILTVLENQSDIHYAMPVRVLNEESISYYGQWKTLQKEHQEKRDLKGAEFLSGFGKEDKLVPVLTIVIYFGEQPWDGPRCMKEMMDLEGVPETLQEMIADYPIHILEVRKYPYIDRFKTDLRCVFGFFQNMSDSEKLKQYLDKNKEEFRRLREDAYDFIAVMSRTSQLEELKKVSEGEEEGVCDMCSAIDQMLEKCKQDAMQAGRKEGRRQGRYEGRSRGRKEGERNGIELARKIFAMAYRGMGREKIAEECNISIKKVEKILEGIL